MSGPDGTRQFDCRLLRSCTMAASGGERPRGLSNRATSSTVMLRAVERAEWHRPIDLRFVTARAVREIGDLTPTEVQPWKSERIADLAGRGGFLPPSPRPFCRHEEPGPASAEAGN